MSDYIDEQKVIFENIQKIYSKNRKTLISIEDELKKDFEEIFKTHSKSYNLAVDKDFNVNPTKYYSLKSRVKTLHSFKEKLYRKNLGLQISESLKLTNLNINKNNSKIKNKIFLFDDIIGLRIVTELKYDCKFAHELIKNENSHFIDKDIIFNYDELNNQPETMRNGLPIFRIKGVYQKKYGFELQIKSKIDEAWGDMDHSLFYKDYSVSPIKNTVQLTMNNVGHLFDKVENLLLGLRNSEANYKEKKDEIDFLNELSGSVFNEIKNKLGDNYDLSNLASSIKFIQKASKVVKKNSEVKELNFSFLNYAVKDKSCVDYVNSRNANFELIILETLFWHWKGKTKIPLKLDPKNYENNLKLFLDILIENLCNNVQSISNLSFIDISKSKIENFAIKYTDLFKPTPIYLDVKAVYQLLIIDALLSDAINEYFEDSNFNDDILNEMLKDIYIFSYLKQNINSIIDNIENTFPDFIEYNNLNDFIYSINEKIQNQLNIYKIDENFKTLKEVKFLEKQLSHILENIKQINEQ